MTTVRNLFAAGLLAIVVVVAPRLTAAGLGDCGQPSSEGPRPTASDALTILKAAVSLVDCELTVCDVDSSGTITPTDALRVLNAAVGQDIVLDCPADTTTTTTVSTTTTSSTSSTFGTTTSTTTTTTILPATWTEVLDVFTLNNCTIAGCHGDSSESGGLGGLDEFDAGYSDLVGAPVGCVPSGFTSRVVPGDPDASFLLAKLDDTHDCGVLMPSGLTPLSDQHLDIVRRWILVGAPKN